MAISPETIEEVQRVSNVYDVISDYLTLKKSGSVYVALCPFHNEKTPSFVVSPTKNIFKCFGCGISGNAVKFVMEYEKTSFQDAILKIAQKYGVNVKLTSSGKEKKNHKYYLITRQLTEFFKNSLLENRKAKEYLKSRGILARTIADFEIGYAPENNDILSFSLKNDISMEDLEKVGIVNQNKNQIFRDRIIFPIKNHKGNVVAFGGRSLSDNNKPKYLNSPETEIYKKSEVIYGIFEALDYIKEKRQAIVVEGYLDLISLYQIGIKNIVATLGTAFTKYHAKLLKKYIEEAILMFDSDEAGKKAAILAASHLISQGIKVKYVYYSDAKDPDELSKQGLQKVKQLIQSSEDIIIFLIKKLKELKKMELNTESQIKTYKKIYDYILYLVAHIKEPSLKSSYINIIAEMLKKNQTNIEDDIKKIEKEIYKISSYELKNANNINLEKLSKKDILMLKYMYDNPNILTNKYIYDIVSNFENLNKFVHLIVEGDISEYGELISRLEQEKVSISYEHFLKLLNDYKTKYEKQLEKLKMELKEELSEEEILKIVEEKKNSHNRRFDR